MTWNRITLVIHTEEAVESSCRAHEQHFQRQHQHFLSTSKPNKCTKDCTCCTNSGRMHCNLWPSHEHQARQWISCCTNHNKDRHTIFQHLLETRACHYVPQGTYTHYKNCSIHLCSDIRQHCKWTKLTEWIDNKLSILKRTQIQRLPKKEVTIIV